MEMKRQLFYIFYLFNFKFQNLGDLRVVFAQIIIEEKELS
jgi:hypothetical protein